MITVSHERDARCVDLTGSAVTLPSPLSLLFGDEQSVQTHRGTEITVSTWCIDERPVAGTIAIRRGPTGLFFEQTAVEMRQFARMLFEAAHALDGRS